MARLHKPRPLREGDLVQVVAPASYAPDEVVQRGVAVLESWGLRVRLDPALLGRRHLYFAGTPAERGAELMQGLLDPEVRALVPVRGGYGLASVLPHLDAAAVRAAEPTLVVGCSDLTVLLTWLTQEVGWTCLHGPMVSGLARGDDPDGDARLRQLLFEGGKAPALRSAFDGPDAWCLAPGNAVGPATGGNLAIVASTCGTPAQLDARGRVLFLEDVGERPYRIDRMFVQLDQAGILDAAAALVLGDFTGCAEGDLSWRDAVRRVLRRKPLPVLAGVPFGHGNPNLAFPLGTRVAVDAGAGTVSFREAHLD